MVPKIFIIACALIHFCSGASAPFITPCLSNDAECMKQNAVGAIPIFAAGIPDLGVETLDPLFFKHVDSSSPSLKFILSDITVTGLKTCKPNKIQRDVANNKIHLQLSCVASLDGDYELKGQVLILKIEGKGKIHVLLRKLVIDVDLDVTEKVGKDGEKYLRIKKFNHTYTLKEKSDVVFEGLFADNDVLSKAADDLIKNNGNDVVNEIGGPMFEATITKVTQNINNFFGKVPLSQLSLD
ncbi:putative beta-carotene-binding protein [Trichoplusia ni]|uniref:Beta-carotene-binding protein n=1 Tax=Trichoplusia ni TaxID=7111 RepID=A0A7E5WUQ2_TRINI|nr:putative beta-carotene-binding protein [Trichoplusia ni]